MNILNLSLKKIYLYLCKIIFFLVFNDGFQKIIELFIFQLFKKLLFHLLIKINMINEIITKIEVNTSI